MKREFESLNIFACLRARERTALSYHRHKKGSEQMSNAKEASEAEAFGMKLLNSCRKKASEKDLLTVLEVRVMRF